MTTTNEWRDLPTFEDVADAKRAGDEIEVNTGPHWESWKGTAWMNYMEYRARPARPKMKKVKLLGYFDGVRLFWQNANYPLEDSKWKRVPAEDKEIEVDQ